MRLLRGWELADGKTIAIDSTIIRAQNSLKNNLNQSKIELHLEYIDYKVAEYEAHHNPCDQEESRQKLQAKIEQQNLRKEGYHTREKPKKCEDGNIAYFVLHKKTSTPETVYIQLLRLYTIR